MDYTLFADNPEFCADYVISNRKTGQIYTSKFGLTVVDLTHIELATEEDKGSHLDLWASFFKAKTWEELDMLAQKDPYIEKTVTRVIKLTEDEKLRMIAEARQDQIMQLNDFHQHYQDEIAARDAKLAEMDSLIADMDSLIAEQNSLIADMDSLIADMDSLIAEQNSLVADMDSRRAELDSRRAKLDSRRAELDSRHAKLDSRRAELDSRHAELKAKLASYKNK